MGGRKNLELKNFRGFNRLKTGTFACTNILFGQSLQRKQRYMFFQIFVGKDKDLREPYQGFQSQLREYPALEFGCRVNGATEGVLIRKYKIICL